MPKPHHNRPCVCTSHTPAPAAKKEGGEGRRDESQKRRSEGTREIKTSRILYKDMKDGEMMEEEDGGVWRCKRWRDRRRGVRG